MANKARPASDLPKAAVEALWHGNVIEAIKVVRQERNIGLKEAKDSVDAYIVSQPALKKKMDQVLSHGATEIYSLADRISDACRRSCVSRDPWTMNPHPAMSALKKEDIDTLMQFYAPSYDYHGLKADDVRRVWSEVFPHYTAVESVHLFSDIKVTQVGNVLRADVTCTGGLYGTDERSGDRVTLDSWFREVHYLVKEGDAWRFLNNAGEVPAAAPFALAPHHPLF
jgi:hypothetical protein